MRRRKKSIAHRTHFFFFSSRRRHTRFKCDWSSDVCSSDLASQFVLPASGLRQPRFTISSAGWQQKLAHNTLVALDLLARNGYHGFAFVDQQPAQPGGIFLLRDHRKDRYRAVTISARHVFSESTELFAAYPGSRARSTEVLIPALGPIFYAPKQSGPVAWDAPNRLLTWGWMPQMCVGVQPQVRRRLGESVDLGGRRII